MDFSEDAWVKSPFMEEFEYGTAEIFTGAVRYRSAIL